MASRRDYKVGGKLGKIDSPRLDELKEEFIQNGGLFKQKKAKDLFKLLSNPQLNKESFAFKRDSQYPYFTRTVFNNGILGYVDYLDDEHLIKGNSLAVGMIGMQFFYMEHDFYAGQFTKTAFPLFDGFNEKIALWFISWFNKSSIKYQSVLVRDFESVFYDTTLDIPYYKGQIALDYIEKYIDYIEQERKCNIEKFIQAAGFEDCSLSPAEEAAFDKMQNGALSYKPFKISDLFTQYRGKEKAPNQVKAGSVPMINETSTNNGFTKLATPTKVFEGNAITISINYATTVFYQPYDFCASVNISILKNDDILTEQTALYFAALLQKNNRRYDYNQKISKDKINDTILSLPVSVDGSIDYAFMENYINAIKKQTIARVKEYIDSEYKTEEQLHKEIQPTITPLRIHDTYQPGRIPLYTLCAACGYFNDGQLPEEEGWIDATDQGFTPDKDRYFAVHAKGDSMLPKIHDGDICVFEWYRAGSRNGEIVLTQSSEYDDAYGGRYTIKRYHSEKTVTDEGWQHAKVELQPLNPDFNSIELNDDNTYRTIGIFKCVL